MAKQYKPSEDRGDAEEVSMENLPTINEAAFVNRREKGSAEFIHDLFKCKVNKAKKNIAYKKGEVILVDFEHVHFFHTFDSHGRPQEFTGAVGGHKHRLKIRVNANGDFVAECGPALREIEVKKGKHYIKKWEPVSFIDEQHLTDDEPTRIVDGHTHDVEYVQSESLSKQKVAKQQADDKARFAAMQAPARQVVVEKTESAKA